MVGNGTPVLSVCVPTYNRAALLRECLTSVIASARGHERDVEIVVSDNASSDTTPAVVRELAGGPCAVLYFCNEENTGERNFQIAPSHARGRYVWLLGDDDKLAVSAIGEVLSRIRAGYDLIVCNYSVWSRDFTQRKLASAMPLRRDTVLHNRNQLLARLGMNLSFISAVVCDRELLFGEELERSTGFQQYGFLFLSWVYLSLRPDSRSCYISRAIVENRADNSPVDRATWDRNWIVGGHAVLDALQQAGYSSKAVSAAKGRLLRDYVLRTLLGRVRDGEDVSGLMNLLRTRYGRSGYFWLVCWPAAHLPASPLRGLTWLARARRRTRFNLV